jgi:hypothetical protein
MNIANKLIDNIQSWGVLAIIIVIVSIVLIKFKSVSGVTSDLNTTIESFTTALSEPKNWVSIVIIAIVGFAVLKLFKSKR